MVFTYGWFYPIYVPEGWVFNEYQKPQAFTRKLFKVIFIYSLYGLASYLMLVIIVVNPTHLPLQAG